MGRSRRFSDRYNNGGLNDGVIFSYVDGFVWLSWPGSVSMVRVGEYQAVATAMQDFMAQCELAERLERATNNSISDPSDQQQ